MRAVRYRKGLRDHESAPGWICRIVMNEARRHARRALPPEVPEPAEEERHEAGEVRAAVAALPERQRLALFLRYYADLDYAGIAEALDISRGTVSATLHAAHANLQTQLSEVQR